MAANLMPRRLLTAALAFALAAGSAETAQAQTNRKIDNAATAQRPAADYTATPGSKGSQTEALGAFMFLLPKMLKAIRGDREPGAVFAGTDTSSQSITTMLRQLLETQPQKRPALEAILREHGYFQSLDEWALTGDEFTLGMIAAGMKRDNRAYYDRIFTLTPAELAAMSDQRRPGFEIMREFSDEENAYYDAYLDDYEDLLERHGALLKRAPANQ